MEKFFILFLLLLAPISARAMDHRSQFGAGGALGGTFPAPWGSPDFRSSVGPKVPALGFWGRYIPGTPEIGTELSYNYLSLSKQDIHTHSVIFSFISRQNPWGNFHPFYAFGMGWSKSDNFYITGDWEAPIFKLTAGIDFEINETTDVGFYLNHYSVFKNRRDGEQNLHAITPVVTINYYFGTPAPLPPPPPAPSSPAPKAAAPAPAPAANVVAQPEESPKPAKPAAPVKPKAKAKAKAAPKAKAKAKAKNALKKKKKKLPAPPAEAQ